MTNFQDDILSLFLNITIHQYLLELFASTHYLDTILYIVLEIYHWLNNKTNKFLYTTYLLPSTLRLMAAVLTSSLSSPRLPVSTSSRVLLSRIHRLGRGSVDLKY